MTGITTVILIKESGMGSSEIDEYYLRPLAKEGIPTDSIEVLPLLYTTPSKVTAKVAKAYLDKLIGKIPESVSKLIVADSTYFKTIAKVAKVSSYYGTTVPGAYKDYEKFTCVSVPNHKSLFKQPENAQLITLGLKAIAGTSTSVRIDSVEYGFEYGSDREILDSLHKHPVLSADIETDGLGLTSKIVSISFAWTKHDGVAIDLTITGPHYTKKFIEAYRGKFIFHGGLFDAKLLIRNWWMKHESDWEGMMEGLAYFRNFDDTMIMAYLAKNATTHVALGLKELALEYVGNYAIEITDITKYSKKEILNYNLIDVLGTFYLWEKYQAELTSRPYLEIFQPSIYTLLKIMIVGLPMDSDRVQEVNKVLTAKEQVIREQIQTNNCVIAFTDILRRESCEKANTKLKKLVKPLSDFDNVQFNPASHLQVASLLFDMLKLPILDTTKTGAPSTGGDVLEDLQNHTKDQDVLDLLGFIQELTDLTKINGTFIAAFLQEKDFLHGSHKLGGTQSGRLSCLVGNSMVLSSEGLVPISDLTLSHKVQVLGGGHKSIINIWDNGQAPVYRITLKDGRQITGTSNHRFLTKDGYLSLEDIYGINAFSKYSGIHRQGSAIVEQKSTMASSRYSYINENKSNKSKNSIAITYRSSRIKRTRNYKISTKAVTNNSKADSTNYSNVQKSRFNGTRRYSKKITSTLYTCPINNTKKFYCKRNNLQRKPIKKQIKNNPFYSISRLTGRNSQTISLHPRWQGISINAKTFLGNREDMQQTYICTSNSDDGTSKNSRNTSRVCSAPCERRQDRQSHTQFSVINQRSSFKTASGYSSIQQVDFMGVERVYDVEVETDHCYLVNGIWSHNSSDPNVSNLPAHGPMGKLVKSCIIAPPGKTTINQQKLHAIINSFK